MRILLVALATALGIAGCSSKQERFEPGPTIDSQFSLVTIEDWVANGHHLAVYDGVVRQHPSR